MQLFKTIKLLSSMIFICSSSLLMAEQELNLDLTDNSPAFQFTDKDWQLLREQAKEVLNNDNDDISGFWSNPETGNTGSIKSVSSLVEKNGTICRDLEFVNKITHSVTTTEITICKQRGEKWQEIGPRSVDVQEANNTLSEDNSNSSVVFTDGVEPVDNKVKILSETSDKCRALAAKIEEYKGQILKRSVARDRYEAECQR